MVRHLSAYRRVRWVNSVEDDTWANSPPPLGVVVAVVPPEALEVLAKIRSAFPYVPAIVLGQDLSSTDIEQTFALHASHLPLDVEANGIMPFVFRCLTEEAVCDERVGCVVESLVRGGLLTAREAELLVLVLADIPRADIPERMCISENTLEAHTRQLLRKLEAGDLDTLAARIFRVALQSDGRASRIPGKTSGSGERPAVGAVKTDNVVAITSVRRREG